jgi:hypothetical protein
VPRSIGISACRRELNNHNAAGPREGTQPLRLPWLQVRVDCRNAEKQSISPSRRPTRGLLRADAAQSYKDREPLCLIEPAHCVGSSGFHSVRRAAELSVGASALGQVARRLEFVAGHGCQRGAGSTCGRPPGISGPWQAHRRQASGAALPNPSLKRSANGRPPGPGRRYGVHFRQPGPGVLPSAPA